MPTCIIVEDDADLRRLFRIALSSEGFDILESGNARDAIVLLERSTPDVAFIDLNMPQGSGSAVLAYIKRTPHLIDVKTIVVTANSRANSRVEGLGADLFMVKPVAIEQLPRLAYRLLGTR